MTTAVATVHSSDGTRPSRDSVRLPDDRRITFDRFGEEGPAVLLLHGIPGWRGTFSQVGARVGRRCRS